MNMAKRRLKNLSVAVLHVALGAAAEARADIVTYATADNGVTNLFGTMDLTTGQFTQISTTNQLFGSLTTGPGGVVYGGGATIDLNLSSNFNLYTISPSGAPTPFGTVTAPSLGFYGLVPTAAAGFFADNVTFDSSTGFLTATLLHIASDGGNSLSIVGTLGTSFDSFNTGNLAFGPDGRLYFNAENGAVSPLSCGKYDHRVAATAIGSKRSSRSSPLTMVSTGLAGGTDTFALTNPTIYTIDTTTGMATAIGRVSDLPAGYTLDTMARAVPEPASITLLGTGILVILVSLTTLRMRATSSRRVQRAEPLKPLVGTVARP